MTPREAEMRKTLADIMSKPSTPGRKKAAANISAALAKEFPSRKRKEASPEPSADRVNGSAKSPPRKRSEERKAKELTFYDKERLKTLADGHKYGDKVRDWARRVLDGGESMTERDAEFLKRLERK